MVFDFAHGTVDGHPVFGQSVPAIEAGLGRPDYVEHFTRRVDLGYGARSRPRVEVIVNGTAWAIELESPSDVEARLGRLLELTPQALQTRIADRYAGVFPLGRSYHCDVKGCFGRFFNSNRSRRIIFGRTRGHTYVGLQLTNPPK